MRDLVRHRTRGASSRRKERGVLALAISTLGLLAASCHTVEENAIYDAYRVYGEVSMLRAVRYDDAETISCKLIATPLAARIGAAKELLLSLDATEGIRSSGVFESARVTVEPKVGGETWFLDFHLAWPEPQLNNQHLNVLKLVNWAGAVEPGGVADPTTSEVARTEAVDKLRAAIDALCNTDFVGRIELVGGAP